MTEKHKNLQNLFLETIIKNVETTIFLVNGVKLTGVVTAYDQYTVVLERNNLQQMIFKHGISTIMPVRPIKLSTPYDNC